MLYKKQSLDFEIIKYMYDKQYLRLGDICGYEWSYYVQKKDKLIYPKYKFSKEICYSSDIIFIKNPFKKNLKKKDVLIIFLFCCIFQYYDFAEFLISNLYKKFFNDNDLSSYIRLIKNLNNIDQKIIKENLDYIYSKKKYGDIKNLLNSDSEYYLKKFGLV